MTCFGGRRVRKGGLLFALGAGGALAAAAVTGEEKWSYFYDGGLVDQMFGVAIDSQGNVVSAGYSASTPGTDGVVERRLLDETLAWRYFMDNPATDTVGMLSADAFYAVAVDPSDNVLVAGVWTGNWSGADGYWNTPVVRKYTPGGTLSWEWKGGPTLGPWGYARAVTTDASGNVYVAGTKFGNWGSEEYAWAVWKLDPAGVLQSGFPVVYNHSSTHLISDIALGIAVDSEGSFVVVGVRGVSTLPDDTHRDIDWHVRKYAADRTLVWEATFSGPKHLLDYANAVAIDARGDVYVAGCTNVGTDNTATGADWDSLVLKYAKDTGEMLWYRQGGTSAGVDAKFQGAAIGPLETLIVVGTEATIGTPPIMPRTELLDANTGEVLAAETYPATVDIANLAVACRGNLVVFGGYSTGVANLDGATGLYELAPIPNREPLIDQEPWADVAVGAVGEPVSFHVRAHDPDGDALTATWTFSNAPDATGLDVQHAFTPSGGHYKVTATVSDGTHQVVRSMEFIVGDPLRLPALSADVNFRTPGRDVATLRCRMELPDGFTPGARTVTVDIGGVERSFHLDEDGRASTEDGTAALVYLKKPKLWALTVKLARGDYAAAWADEGLVSRKATRLRVTIKTTVAISGDILCAHRIRERYTAVRGKVGHVR